MWMVMFCWDWVWALAQRGRQVLQPPWGSCGWPPSTPPPTSFPWAAFSYQWPVMFFGLCLAICVIYLVSFCSWSLMSFYCWYNEKCKCTLWNSGYSGTYINLFLLISNEHVKWKKDYHKLLGPIILAYETTHSKCCQMLVQLYVLVLTGMPLKKAFLLSVKTEHFNLGILRISCRYPCVVLKEAIRMSLLIEEYFWKWPKCPPVAVKRRLRCTVDEKLSSTIVSLLFVNKAERHDSVSVVTHLPVEHGALRVTGVVWGCSTH